MAWIKAEDIIGKKFSRLTVIDVVSRKGRHYAICICECGGVASPSLTRLRKEETRSCGCLRAEVTGRLRLSHGHARAGKLSPEYRTWADMVARCSNPSHDPNKAYFHKVIRVCNRWRSGENGKSGFQCFLEDMGEKPSPKHSIERTDPYGHYEPDNCVWLPLRLQNRSKKNTRFVNVFGVRFPLAEAIEKYGRAKEDTIRMRIHRGWNPEVAIITPTGKPPYDYPVLF